jgi:threonine/homoserine/homoserine lactone efflux protein
MTTAQALLAFLVAATLLTLAPGPDSALILRSAAVRGARDAWAAAAGISVGCLMWGAAVSAGLGALLAASPQAFTALKWAGAAYLVWLGLGLLLKPRQSPAVASAVSGATSGEAFRQGLFTNALNPKIGVFYVTFLPQFIPAGASVAAFSFVLAAIHVALSLVWFAVLIVATAKVSRALSRPATIAALDRLTGAVFVGFGVKLALTRL